MNAAWMSLLLVVASAGLTFLSVRNAAGTKRLLLFGLALILLAFAFHIGRIMGGYWSGFYLLLSAYFLACMAMPWLNLTLEKSRAR